MDLRRAGLVEAWAAGATWNQIMDDSTLDDGDVARLLMRTADLLRQVWSGARAAAVAWYRVHYVRWPEWLEPAQSVAAGWKGALHNDMCMTAHA